MAGIFQSDEPHAEELTAAPGDVDPERPEVVRPAGRRGLDRRPEGDHAVHVEEEQRLLGPAPAADEKTRGNSTPAHGQARGDQERQQDHQEREERQEPPGEAAVGL
jgi:hypothetical protein